MAAMNFNSREPEPCWQACRTLSQHLLLRISSVRDAVCRVAHASGPRCDPDSECLAWLAELTAVNEIAAQVQRSMDELGESPGSFAESAQIGAALDAQATRSLAETLSEGVQRLQSVLPGMLADMLREGVQRLQSVLPGMRARAAGRDFYEFPDSDCAQWLQDVNGSCEMALQLELELRSASHA